ncbi:MAG: hypothetical protein K2H18_06980, partial [Muribaculaceae bacterium]|nr:hypothetical protein [Muribaculaceae bacterium]
VVVLPVSIVAIVYAAMINSDNKRAKVLIKAIESNCGIDADKLAEALRKPKKTAREILNLRLLRGCIFSFIGLIFCIIAIITLCVGSEFTSDEVSGPLLIGGALLAIGLSYLIVYYVTRKQIKE